MGTFGQYLFDAYRKKANNQAHDGTPIPEWMILKQSVRDNWEEVAYAARVYEDVTRFREEIENRLKDWLRIFVAMDKKSDESTRVFSRMMELVWVLYPGLDDNTGQAQYLLALIEEENRQPKDE